LKRLAACLALLALAVGAQAQEHRGRRGGPGSSTSQRGYADPSAAIAAEIAFARLARDKGQWAAFKATAAPDAVMFTPAMVLAQQWLRKQSNPSTLLTWQPYQVWSSCDGSLMLTSGAWQRGDRHGWFTTVWQRQPDGAYKWVFDHGDAANNALTEPDMIAAKVADCPDRRPGEHPAGGPRGDRRKPEEPARAPSEPFDPTARQGHSVDGTLTWQVTADATGTHDFTAKLLVDGKMQDIRKEHVAAPGERASTGSARAES
jgi:hypothetical protein